MNELSIQKRIKVGHFRWLKILLHAKEDNLLNENVLDEESFRDNELGHFSFHKECLTHWDIIATVFSFAIKLFILLKKILMASF